MADASQPRAGFGRSPSLISGAAPNSPRCILTSGVRIGVVLTGNARITRSKGDVFSHGAWRLGHDGATFLLCSHPAASMSQPPRRGTMLRVLEPQAIRGGREWKGTDNTARVPPIKVELEDPRLKPTVFHVSVRLVRAIR